MSSDAVVIVATKRCFCHIGLFTSIASSGGFGSGNASGLFWPQNAEAQHDRGFSVDSLCFRKGSDDCFTITTLCSEFINELTVNP